MAAQSRTSVKVYSTSLITFPWFFIWISSPFWNCPLILPLSFLKKKNEIKWNNINSKIRDLNLNGRGVIYFAIKWINPKLSECFSQQRDYCLIDFSFCIHNINCVLLKLRFYIAFNLITFIIFILFICHFIVLVLYQKSVFLFSNLFLIDILLIDVFCY